MTTIFVHFLDLKINKSIEFNYIPHIGEKFSLSENGDIYVVKDILYNNFAHIKLNCMYQNQHLIANSYIDTLLQVAPTVFVCLHLRELFFYNHRHNYNRHSYLK